MGHHGTDEPSPLMRAAMDKVITEKQFRASEKEKLAAMEAKNETGIGEKLAGAEKPTFGATGEYPMGKLDKTDEGEIAFGVTSHRGKVIINFGKPVAWLGMDAKQAAGLAAVLIQHVERCRDIGNEQHSEATAKEHA
jgi:hypothetical protein